MSVNDIIEALRAELPLVVVKPREEVLKIIRRVLVELEGRGADDQRS